MNNKFKVVLLQAILFLVFGTAFAQTKVKKYVFLGFGMEEKVPGCMNNPATSVENHWLLQNGQYEKAYDSLKGAVRRRYPGRFTRINQFTVKTGEPRFIALIEKTWKCGGKNLSFYDGKNETEITDKVESEKKAYAEVVSYRQISLIDCQVEIEKLERKDNAAAGIDWDEATTVNYEDVTAKYLYVTKADKALTIARFKNNRTDVTSRITFTLPGNKIIIEELEPGWMLTRKIEDTNFTVGLIFLPYKPGDTSESVTEWTKKRINDIVTEEDGKPNSKYDPACLCVRD